MGAMQACPHGRPGFANTISCKATPPWELLCFQHALAQAGRDEGEVPGTPTAHLPSPLQQQNDVAVVAQ